MKKNMESDEDENDLSNDIVYLNHEIFSNKKKLILFLNILEKLSQDNHVILPSKITKSSHSMNISNDFSLFAFYDNESNFRFGFIKEKIPDFSQNKSNDKSGVFNSVREIEKKKSTYLQHIEHICECTINSEAICRYPVHKEFRNNYLEAFISTIACFKKIGPSIYGIYEQEYVSWILQKGKCDMSQSILNLDSHDSAIHLAQSCISLLLKASEVRLILFDLKPQNLIDLGPDIEKEKRIFAIDFDPRFTLFGPKSFSALSFVVNATLLLSSIQCWYGNSNMFVKTFISEHNYHLKHHLEIWNENNTLSDLCTVLKEKFFNKNEEYIGKFHNNKHETTDNPEIWEIAKKFKTMFENMANEFIFTSNDNVPLFNCAHFCQILEWLGVTRTAGCDNEKLLSMAMKNLPENWSLNLNGNEFQILYQNSTLQIESFERPPDFKNLKEQLNWYMKLMMKKHNNAKGNEKDIIGKKLLNIILSKENEWFIHEQENVDIKHLLIQKLLEMKNRKHTSNEMRMWCNEHLEILFSH